MKSILFLPLVTLSLAAPLEERKCKPTCTSYVANYDDLPFNDGSANPINLYNNLNYTTFQVDAYDGFIPPTSFSNWAMAFGGSGNISVPKSDRKKTFELNSFSYACVSGVPQPECRISIWGFKAHGQVIKRDITFPRLDPGHPIEDFMMNRTTFNGQWKDLKSVGFSIARADNGGDMFGGLALDDLGYEIVERPCM
ncbi:hypothetical protein GQ43DRAFT_475703 [Delitschia confertaspora ATCC 74209]|uniref:Uncharacterized protein n=1 Tax=Delitschia confertaspora ATCC 74209 TaxID=1513339 RepID=A0A9P4MRN1_9PLEO|nr:hypothetical protein GQ43DRAFT_475703 [Delitschia confertaspora ATCC 74209]